MTESQVNISTETLKRLALVTVSGRIDSSNVSKFDEALTSAAESAHYNVVVDMGGVEFISSAGLRALVALLRESKKHGGAVRLATPSERVNEVLALAGLDSLFECYDSREAAVGSY